MSPEVRQALVIVGGMLVVLALVAVLAMMVRGN